jgi:hypothetical protein
MTGVTHAYDDALKQYMHAHRRDPFKVRAAIHALIDHHKKSPWPSTKDIVSMENSARSLEGVCSVDLDMAWSRALRETPWWKRKNFAKQEDEWKAQGWSLRVINARRELEELTQEAGK